MVPNVTSRGAASQATRTVEQLSGGHLWATSALTSHFDPLQGIQVPELPVLAERLDAEAATFLVHGRGPVGARELEPVTSLARELRGDPELFRRVRVSLGALDDLAAEVLLTRVSFARTPLAAAGLGLLSDLRRLPAGLSREHAIGRISQFNRAAPAYANYTGFYQRGRDELVFTSRSAGPLLGERFGAVVPDGKQLSGVYAARIAPHELFHGIGLDAGMQPFSKVQNGFNEAEASIVGTLRASTTTRRLEREAIGPVLIPSDLGSTYEGYTRVYSGLARMAGEDLGSPAAIAALELRMALGDVRGTASELAARAARGTGGSMRLIRDAAFAGMRANDPAVFTSRLRSAGIAAPDTSIEWMFTEGTRRGWSDAEGRLARTTQPTGG